MHSGTAHYPVRQMNNLRACDGNILLAIPLKISLLRVNLRHCDANVLRHSFLRTAACQCAHSFAPETYLTTFTKASLAECAVSSQQFLPGSSVVLGRQIETSS